MRGHDAEPVSAAEITVQSRHRGRLHDPAAAVGRVLSDRFGEITRLVDRAREAKTRGLVTIRTKPTQTMSGTWTNSPEAQVCDHQGYTSA